MVINEEYLLVFGRATHGHLFNLGLIFWLAKANVSCTGPRVMQLSPLKARRYYLTLRRDMGGGRGRGGSISQ